LFLVFAFTACGDQNANHSDSNTDASNTLQTDSAHTEQSTSASLSDASSAPSDELSGGKTLIVYYSATGNTKEAAEYIALATGGDMFELVPVNPYSSEDLNWNDENSRVVYEHDHPDERAVALVNSTVDNFDEYDTVFIGYPIWWGIAAWPVDGFVEANDFSGKTVIPFCTSASSDLGDSGKLLKEAAETGNWLEGKRFSSGVSQTEVAEWIDSLAH
ncbi:MAG: flavodoxin, partial [Acutalibacteraceae bacterium]